MIVAALIAPPLERAEGCASVDSPNQSDQIHAITNLEIGAEGGLKVGGRPAEFLCLGTRTFPH